MAEISSHVRISASPEAVFDYIDHWPNAMRYLRRMVKWEPVDPHAPTGVGAVFFVGVQAGPTRLDGRLEVVGHERPATIAFRSVDGPRVEGSWNITASGEGALVVLSATYDVPGGLAGRLVASFLSRNAKNDLDSSLQTLKSLVESSS